MLKSDFKNCYNSNDRIEISCLKNFLEAEEIPYKILNEGWLNLPMDSIPFHEAYASFYLQENDIEQFLEFIEKGYT